MPTGTVPGFLPAGFPPWLESENGEANALPPASAALPAAAPARPRNARRDSEFRDSGFRDMARRYHKRPRSGGPSIAQRFQFTRDDAVGPRRQFAAAVLLQHAVRPDDVRVDRRQAEESVDVRRERRVAHPADRRLSRNRAGRCLIQQRGARDRRRLIDRRLQQRRTERQQPIARGRRPLRKHHHADAGGHQVGDRRWSPPAVRPWTIGR